MNRLLIAGILIISTSPLYAQAQGDDPAKLKADAQKVVSIIKGDKAKTQAYCQIAVVGEQMNQACGPSIGATTTRVTFGIVRNAAPVFRPWSPFLTIPTLSRCAAIILGFAQQTGSLAIFAAILRASSSLSNLAAERRPGSHS